MANVSLTQHFTYTVNGVTYTAGSTTTPQTISIGSTEVFDKTYKIGASTSTEILSCGANPETGDNLPNFDFLWIQSDKAGEIQLVCNEGGTLSGNNIENGFVVKLAANIPFILPNDDSRNMGNMDGTFGESQHQDEIYNWQTHWVADEIDRIERYSTVAGDSIVRVVAFT